MADQQPLVPFYDGHASLFSVIPTYVYAALFAVVAAVCGLLWLRRRSVKSEDTNSTP